MAFRCPLLKLTVCLLLMAGSSSWAGTSVATPAGQATSKAEPSSTRSSYTPAILHLRFTNAERAGVGANASGSFLDLTLIAATGDPIGKRVPITTADFAAQLRQLYGQLSKQEPLDVSNPKAPARLLYDLLIAPIAPDLQRLGITTLLIAADQGLQAVPLAALHDGQSFFGERYAFTLTPSIGLTPLGVPVNTPQAHQLGAGASSFDGLAPLPLVPQELSKVEGANGQTYLNTAFTPSVLIDKVADTSVVRVHVATHAEFLPGGPSQARLFTGTGPMNLSSFANLRQRRSGQPLDLIVLSACRTALGDKDSELGFAGLALQAGARSAIGTLWYVDDVATSAFFVQFYRYLNGGMPKAEALQATRIAMAKGLFRRKGDQVVGPDGAILLTGLSLAQQQRISDGLTHPFFWSGITLLGTPW